MVLFLSPAARARRRERKLTANADFVAESALWLQLTAYVLTPKEKVTQKKAKTAGSRTPANGLYPMLNGIQLLPFFTSFTPSMDTYHFSEQI